jgi:hypothetical protein
VPFAQRIPKIDGQKRQRSNRRSSQLMTDKHTMGLAIKYETKAMANISECLSKAAEFQSRAAIATDWQLKATFKDLARFHREMAKYLEQTEQSPKER